MTRTGVPARVSLAACALLLATGLGWSQSRDEIRPSERSGPPGGVTADPPSPAGAPPPEGLIIFDNGPLVTHTDVVRGRSRAQNISLGMNVVGYGASTATGVRIADDFTVGPAGLTISAITFYASQFGSTTTTTIYDARVQIWNGPPNAGGAVIFGDTTTNRIGSSSFSGIFRDAESAPTYTQFPIMRTTADVPVTLGPGTYWVDFMLGGTLPSGPTVPPTTVLGQTSGCSPGPCNAIQWSPSTSTWGLLLNPLSTGAPQDVRFTLEMAGGVIAYDNGPLITHPGPPGDASRLQTSLGMGSFGFTASTTSGFRIADDFTVGPAGLAINTITFYAFQTDSTTTSTFDDARVQIWDGPPNAGGSIVFGDTTTNRFSSSSFSDIYRDAEPSAGDSTRPIMRTTADVPVTLAAGTYWVDFMLGGTLASEPLVPPTTRLGQTSGCAPGTCNAIQWNPTTSTWGPIVDVEPQDVKFTVDGIPATGNFYTVTPCRLMDTRGGAPIGGPALQGGATRSITVAGNCGIPATATAVSLNVTAVSPSVAANIRLFPAGAATPTVSSLNFSAGQTRGNNAIVPLSLGPGGGLAILLSGAGTSHCVIDVNGYFQ